jgi:molybdopterin converting factor subunit 1
VADGLSCADVRVEVLYFAVLRERVGRDGESLELPAGSRVREARAAIAALHPELAPLLPRVQAAVNRTVVGDDHPLSDGDELAFLPPVSGGAGDPPFNRRPRASIRRGRSLRCSPSKSDRRA